MLSKKTQSEKATLCMTATLWHSGKDKTMETVQRPVVAGIKGKWWIEGAQRIFQEVKAIPVYYNSAYVSLYICPNP